MKIYVNHWSLYYSFSFVAKRLKDFMWLHKNLYRDIEPEVSNAWDDAPIILTKKQIAQADKDFRVQIRLSRAGIRHFQ